MSRRAEVGLVAGMLALYVALTVSSLRQWSATFDEGAHLPAGYTYWAFADYRLNPEHPPLVKRLAALPLLLLDVKVRRDDDVAWESRRQWEFGRRFLYHWNDADRLLLFGRLPIVALAVALAASVFFWARRLYGPPVAAIALALTVLSPDVVAHGQIVTTDVGIALFSFLTVAALERLRAGTTRARGGALVAAFALAAATKFSAALIVPILAVLAAVLVSRGVLRLRTVAGLAIAMGLATSASLWACYGFRYAAFSDAVPAFNWARVVPRNGWVSAPVLLAREHQLLPEAFLYGFLRFFKAQETRPAFLLGQVSEEGWWYYFPVTFAVKTPVPLLLLLAAAALTSVRRRDPDALRECFLWLPPVLYMAMVMTSSLNIGHRHLLPLYPYLFVLAARSGAGGLAHPSRAVRAATAALLLWYAAGTLRLHPHSLAYFNELAGGPRNGHRWLGDSNLDWGQDLKGLKAWMDRHGVGEIKLSYFGTADPDYYGIHGGRLPGYPRPSQVTGFRSGEWVAVSATHLQGLYLEADGRRLMERLGRETPVGHVGYSILLYRPTFDYEPAEPLY